MFILFFLFNLWFIFCIAPISSAPICPEWDEMTLMVEREKKEKYRKKDRKRGRKKERKKGKERNCCRKKC